MAKKYIKITSVKDIETGKINFKNINDRYIDKNNNRYATRFNLRTHKIDIVKIVLGNQNTREARYNEAKMLQNNKQEEQELTNHPCPVEIPEWIIKGKYKPKSNIIPQGQINDIELEISKLLERLKGLISNIKKSEAFDKKKNGNQDFVILIDIFFERNIISEIAQVQNLCSEFKRFPKKNTYYINMLEKKRREFVKAMNNNEQMMFFSANFISEHYFKMLKNALELLNMVELESLNAKKVKIPQEKQIFFKNITQSLYFIKEKLEEEITKTLGWLKSTNVI